MRRRSPRKRTPADMNAHGTPQPLEIDPLRDPERRRRAAQASARDIALGGDPDMPYLLAAHDAIAPLIADARAEWDGRFPPIRSEEWLDAPDSVKVATLLTCGLAWLVADPHRVVRGALKQVSDDIHGGNVEFWRRTAAEGIPYRELERRRSAPVTPLRCTRNGCSTVLDVDHPLPANLEVVCATHGGDGE